MNRFSFDDLMRFADGDGASVVGRIPIDPADGDLEVQGLLDAWSIERQRAVDAELILVEVLSFLARKVGSNRILADSDRREAQELIRIIRFRLGAQP